jgi:hypothetical protein
MTRDVAPVVVLHSPHGTASIHRASRHTSKLPFPGITRTWIGTIFADGIRLSAEYRCDVNAPRMADFLGRVNGRLTYEVLIAK